MGVKLTPNKAHHGVSVGSNAASVSTTNTSTSTQGEPTFFSSINDHYSTSDNTCRWLRPRTCTDTRLCLEVNPDLGTGRMDFLLFRNGVTFSVGDFLVWDNLERAYPPVGPQFGFNINLAGRLEVTTLERGVRQHISNSDVWLRAGDIGPMRTHAFARNRIRGVSVDLPADMVKHWREEGPSAFNAAIGGILAGSRPGCSPVRAVNGRILEIAGALVDVNTETVCGRLHTESLVLGLLAELLAPDAATDHVTGIGIGARVAREKRAALDEAMDILRTELLDPPTIAQLARRVGLNEFYLTAGFRERFGMSIADCARTLRMTLARGLIEREGHSVQQAAVAVGFSNPSHFAAAFRRVHGCLPSRLGVQSGKR